MIALSGSQTECLCRTIESDESRSGLRSVAYSYRIVLGVHDLRESIGFRGKYI
jgi:hypothetical protein